MFRAIILSGLLSSLAVFAADKTYQVTGPVLEVSPSRIVVEKGKDRWELARDASTKASTEPKVGDKVTVMYSMTATEIEVKPGAATGSKKGSTKK